jgi:ribonuclease PH
VSVGLLEGKPLLDLCYEEDSAAAVDGNFVLTGQGQLIEVQISGEEAVFSEKDLSAMLRLARIGAQHLQRLQRKALDTGTKK